jgi:hypothetical protein
VLGSKPSSSARSWLSVCPFSSWPPKAPGIRLRPNASSSSMKMMQGAPRRACSKRSLTRAARGEKIPSGELVLPLLGFHRSRTSGRGVCLLAPCSDRALKLVQLSVRSSNVDTRDSRTST